MDNITKGPGLMPGKTYNIYRIDNLGYYAGGDAFEVGTFRLGSIGRYELVDMLTDFKPITFSAFNKDHCTLVGRIVIKTVK